MNILETCKFMGWDYHTYMAQPQWFTYLISLRLTAESKANKYIALKDKTNGRK